MKTKKNFTLRVFEVPDKNQLDVSVLLQSIQALINNQKIICTFESVCSNGETVKIKNRRNKS